MSARIKWTKKEWGWHSPLVMRPLGIETYRFSIKTRVTYDDTRAVRLTGKRTYYFLHDHHTGAGCNFTRADDAKKHAEVLLAGKDPWAPIRELVTGRTRPAETGEL